MKCLLKARAFTVAELMIALAVGALALVAAVSAAITMQRSVAAGEEFASDKSEQTRLSDYLALDLRRALTIQQGVGDVLMTLTIPNYYEADGKTPRTPVLFKTPDLVYIAQYDPNPVTIVYRRVNDTITRQVGPAEPVVIAANVADFEFPEPVPLAGAKVAKTRISFIPSFQRNGTVSAATRDATTIYNTVRLRNFK